MVANADTFLSWRWGYSSGDLTSFDNDDVEEFLLDWVPRKFSAGPEEAPVLCRGVQAMVEFLADTDRLVGGYGRAARVMTHIDGLLDEVTAAMADESKFGMSKTLFSMPLSDDDGQPLPNMMSLVNDDDLPSIEELQVILDQRLSAFNNLSLEERTAATDPLMDPPATDPIELPITFVRPPVEAVERSIRSAALVGRVHQFVDFLGDKGVKLTDTGNLKLADTKHLVELLDTGDDFDPARLNRDGSAPVVKTRTSLEMRWLTLIVDLACGCGAATRLKTRINPDPTWSERSVVQQATAIANTLLQFGILSSKPHIYDGGLEALDSLLDDGVAPWLSTVLGNVYPTAFDDIAAFADSVVDTELPGWRESFGQNLFTEFVAARMSEIFETLRSVGLIDWADRVVLEDHRGPRSWSGGLVSLTPFGEHVLPSHIRAAGYSFATLEDLTDADPIVVLNAVATVSITPEEALELWWPERTVTERAHGLAAGAVESGQPVHRLIAFSLLRALDDPAALEPVVRELLDTPCSAHAAMFLLDLELATGDEVGAFFSVGPFIDILFCELIHPDSVVDLFLDSYQAADHDLLDDMWRFEQQETEDVLEALGNLIPDKQLAKAARKALFKHRSWMMNPQR